VLLLPLPSAGLWVGTTTMPVICSSYGRAPKQGTLNKSPVAWSQDETRLGGIETKQPPAKAGRLEVLDVHGSTARVSLHAHMEGWCRRRNSALRFYHTIPRRETATRQCAMKPAKILCTMIFAPFAVAAVLIWGANVCPMPQRFQLLSSAGEALRSAVHEAG
jgi:hypothetical protein